MGHTQKLALFLLVTRGGVTLLAGHTHQPDESDCGGLQHCCHQQRPPCNPYPRRCPAPGPKTAEELRPYTPLVCYNRHCRTHPTARVSNLLTLPAAPIKECSCDKRRDGTNMYNCEGKTSRLQKPHQSKQHIQRDHGQLLSASQVTAF
jgi:hypothetical protein